MLQKQINHFFRNLAFLTRASLPSRDEKNAELVFDWIWIVSNLFLGMLIILVASLFRWLAGSVGGAVLAGLLLPGGAWWLTRGRGLHALAKLVHELPMGKTQEPIRTYLCLALFQVLIVLKLLCVGIIVGAGVPGWLGIAWIFSGAVFREAATHKRGDLHTWMAIIIPTVLLAKFVGATVMVILLLSLAWFAIPSLPSLVSDRFDLSADQKCWALAEMVENVILFVAILQICC